MAAEGQQRGFLGPSSPARLVRASEMRGGHSMCSMVRLGLATVRFMPQTSTYYTMKRRCCDTCRRRHRRCVTLRDRDRCNACIEAEVDCCYDERVRFKHNSFSADRALPSGRLEKSMQTTNYEVPYVILTVSTNSLIRSAEATRRIKEEKPPRTICGQHAQGIKCPRAQRAFNLRNIQ